MAKLDLYDAKRDFQVTPEPRPSRPRARTAGPLTFMIDKHHARRLHYDLRLEMDGVLASWSVPKGPSYDPAVKRLAVETEDHPLAYGGFEGRIPDGEYGAGDSLIWERGSYDTIPPGRRRSRRRRGTSCWSWPARSCAGDWHLVRTRPAGGKAQWLFFKAKDEAANAAYDVVEARPESVLSGRRVTRGPVAAKTLRAAHPSPIDLLLRVWPPMLATLATEEEVARGRLPRGEVRRVPRAGRALRRTRLAAEPERPRPRAALPRAGGGAPTAGGGGGGPRRRDRARKGTSALDSRRCRARTGAPAMSPSTSSGWTVRICARVPSRRGGSSWRACSPGSTTRCSWPRRCAGPIRKAMATRAPRGLGRDRREARRLGVRGPPLDGVAQGEGDRRAGARHRRLHADLQPERTRSARSSWRCGRGSASSTRGRSGRGTRRRSGGSSSAPGARSGRGPARRRAPRACATHAGSRRGWWRRWRSPSGRRTGSCATRRSRAYAKTRAPEDCVRERPRRKRR